MSKGFAQIFVLLIILSVATFGGFQLSKLLSQEQKDGPSSQEKTQVAHKEPTQTLNATNEARVSPPVDISQNPLTTVKQEPKSPASILTSTPSTPHKSIIQVCRTDGTPYGQCSTVNQGFYCGDGNLTEKCSLCGCSDGQTCQATGFCEVEEQSQVLPSSSPIAPPQVTVENIPLPADATPPQLSNGQPTGTLLASTSQTILALTTSEKSTCRYSNASIEYDSMVNTFSNTGLLSHTTIISNLLNGHSYTYYVRCKDAAGNKSIDTFPIKLTVAESLPLQIPTSIPPTSYKLGLVYVYNGPDTYNPNWKTEFEGINKKVETGIEQLINNTKDVSIEILGEVQTDVFCWNPAKIGFQYKTPDIIFESGTIIKGSLFYGGMPGSTFANTGTEVSGELIDNFCKNCNVEKTSSSFRITIDCENSLSYENIGKYWKTEKLSQLHNQISQELGFNFGNYEGVYIIFGRLGTILPTESQDNLKHRCTQLGSIILGYSNLIMAENGILSGERVACDTLGTGQLPFYDKMGWHTMVHEVLHRFGTVDIYQTGTTFGIKSEREKALEIDSKADESIMGNDTRSCMNETSSVCTIDELERVYLDKYNKQKIRLE